jgi:hypothetical protein
MSRIVIAILIYNRHKPIDINYRKRLHGAVFDEALKELGHFELYWNMNHQKIRANATSTIRVHFVHLVQRNARS